MKNTDDPGETHKLISALMDPAIYPHEVVEVRLIETHISWVILTGIFAYKLKKPVSLGFLDFSSLEKRKFYCEEELRLNRRLAPEIYLELVSIRGRPEKPHINGGGEVLEYAVKMLQFPQHAQLDQMLERGELHSSHMDALAGMVADFHQRIAVADASSEYGLPQQILKSVMDTIDQLRHHSDEAEGLRLIDELQQWCETNFSQLHPLFEQRKAQGYIRECHGDMHLRNLAWFKDKPLAFDCIEFNPSLRWNDVISEIAFLVMDLDDRDQQQLARRFLNAYLERSGDYPGVRLLRFYLVYRALVRAMVDAIRIGQVGISPEEKLQAINEAQGYLNLARAYTQYPRPHMIVCHGLSGSGKTTYTQLLLEQFTAIRIRSDVERKRLYGMKPEQRGDKLSSENIYSGNATERTYEYLGQLASVLLQAGYSVIIDATCQKYEQRRHFQNIAQEGGWPYIILDFIATADTLRRRIAMRRHDASDADLTILEQQLANRQALDEAEREYVVSIDTEQVFDVESVIQAIMQHA